MKLNELLSGDAVWEDAFIGLISKNEFIDNLLLNKDCIDFQLYDDLKDQSISRENVRVIEQYNESDDSEWYYDYCGNCPDSQCYECNTEYGEEIKNDIRAMLEV